MIIWFNMYYDGKFVKCFGASNKKDANKECRLFELDYKLPKYSIKAIERPTKE